MKPENKIAARARLPDVKRIAPRVVEFTHADYAAVFNAFRVLLTLGSIQA